MIEVEITKDELNKRKAYYKFFTTNESERKHKPSGVTLKRIRDVKCAILGDDYYWNTIMHLNDYNDNPELLYGRDLVVVRSVFWEIVRFYTELHKCISG